MSEKERDNNSSGALKCPIILRLAVKYANREARIFRRASWLRDIRKFLLWWDKAEPWRRDGGESWIDNGNNYVHHTFGQSESDWLAIIEAREQLLAQGQALNVPWSKIEWRRILLCQRCARRYYAANLGPAIANACEQCRVAVRKRKSRQNPEQKQREKELRCGVRPSR